MDEAATRRWLSRHTPGERLLAGFDLCDVAMAQVVAQVRAVKPDATAADVRAHIRRLKGES
jgi:hypothetical protein